MFEIFIRRPILSGVISVVIVFLGLLAITSLPITQFPDIVPPSVTVTARYTGANADVMAKTVGDSLGTCYQWCARNDLYDDRLYERRYVADDDLF